MQCYPSITSRDPLSLTAKEHWMIYRGPEFLAVAKQTILLLYYLRCSASGLFKCLAPVHIHIRSVYLGMSCSYMRTNPWRKNKLAIALSYDRKSFSKAYWLLEIFYVYFHQSFCVTVPIFLQRTRYVRPLVTLRFRRRIFITEQLVDLLVLGSKICNSL